MLYPITAVAQKNSAALIGLHRGAANPGRSRLSAGSPAAAQAAAPAAPFWLWLCHSAGRAILPAAGFQPARCGRVLLAAGPKPRAGSIPPSIWFALREQARLHQEKEKPAVLRRLGRLSMR